MRRFWEKVNKNGPDGFHYLTGANLGPCWLWTACVSKNGYGVFRLNGKNELPHRLAYQWEVGPIPEGLELDHLCRVHACVRHTEPVTNAENQRRGIHGMKKHCPAGHPYAGDNLRLYGGTRHCRTCKAATARRYRARKKALA